MIAALQFSLVVAIAFFRIRYALYLFVFFLAFAPRSLGLIFADGTQSLTFVRMTFPVILGLFLAAILLRKTPMHQSKPKPTTYLPVMLLLWLSAYKLLATIINGISPIYALEDLMLSGLALLCFYIVSTERFANRMIEVIVITVFLTGAIITLETILSQPLHYPLASQVLIEQDALLVHERGGSYRAQGVFDNPLSLSEFALFTLPLVLYFWLSSKKLKRTIGLAAVGMEVWIILSSGSRSGILVGLLVVATFLMTFYWARLSRPSRLIASLLLIVVVGFSVASAFGLLLAIIGEAQNTAFYLVEDEADRSVLARALQYYQVYTIVMNQPILGFGVMQNLLDVFDAIISIDNYYLRVALEGGIPAFLLFLAFLYTLFRLINRLTRAIGQSREDRLFRAMCIGLLAAFATNKLFLSIPTNNIYFYALMGTFLGVLARRAVIKGYADAGAAGAQ